MEGSWRYNENNELLGFNGTSYEYDNNGNMTKKTMGEQVVAYRYDAAKHLIRVEDGSNSVIAEYYYDPFGRRLWKDIGGKKIYFFYADEGLVGEYGENGEEIKTYGYAPDSFWTANPLFQRKEGEYYWYQNDHMGTPQKIVDASGRVVWTAAYDAFGNCQVDVAEIENNLRLPGQYYDAETGLYYNWNRYYDPSTGRYLQVDPIRLGGGDVNLYRYVRNNPVNGVDTLGLCTSRNPISKDDCLEFIAFDVLPEVAFNLAEEIGLITARESVIIGVAREVGWPDELNSNENWYLQRAEYERDMRQMQKEIDEMKRELDKMNSDLNDRLRAQSQWPII